MKSKIHTKSMLILVLILIFTGILFSQEISNSSRELQNISNERMKGDNPVLEVIPRPTGLISFQGRLTRSGSPVNATKNITFRLYNTESGGTAFWEETQSVSVVNGLFSVMLGKVTPLNTIAVSFQWQLWLGVQPDLAPAELTPRYPLGAVGYAMNLMPGATLVDANPAGYYGWSLWVESNAHEGIYGESHTYNGITGVSDANNMTGVIGTANGATGVKGVKGVIMSAEDDNSAGVWGEKATGGGTSIIGYKDGDYGRAILGTNVGTTGSGVVGKSTNWMGLWGETDDGGHNYGVYTPDNIYSLNYHKLGAIMQIVQNSGSESLEAGDVAVFTGIGEALEKDGLPVIKVAKASSSNSTAVAGVVYSRYNFNSRMSSDGKGLRGNIVITPEGSVSPGEFLLLVVQGPCKVKTSALAGAIKPGDMLSTSQEVGCAEKANEVSISGVKTAAPGSVLGKALETVEAGEKTIYAFITLQ